MQGPILCRCLTKLNLLSLLFAWQPAPTADCLCCNYHFAHGECQSDLFACKPLNQWFYVILKSCVGSCAAEEGNASIHKGGLQEDTRAATHVQPAAGT